MKILLKLDYDGNPYIVLVSQKLMSTIEQCIEDELLERFVELAFRNGVEIKNEADLDSRTDYASIRIKKPA
jgi:tRNA U38,U39,U40 pseudouridine synthase TruA